MSDLELDFDDTTPDGMKNLRKAYEKLQNTLKEEREGSKGLKAFKRTYEIAGKLKDLGAKPGLAELVPETVEVDNVGAWLTEKADLFGWKPQDQSTEPSPENSAEADAQSRISDVTQQLPGDVSDNPDLKFINEAKSVEDLAAFIYARQAGKG